MADAQRDDEKAEADSSTPENLESNEPVTPETDNTSTSETEQGSELAEPDTPESTETLNRTLDDDVENLKIDAAITESEKTEDAAEEVEAEESVEPVPAPIAPIGEQAKKPNLFRRLTASKKRTTVFIIVLIVLIAGILTAIPATRYGILQVFVKKNLTVWVMDSTTGKPVTDAQVSVGSASATTDKNGSATLKSVPVGDRSVTIAKKYYKTVTTNATVGVFTKPKDVSQTLVATGRQISFTAVDAVSKRPIENAKLTVNGSSATTASDGTGVIVVATSPATQKGTLSRSGYNDSAVSLSLTDSTKNTFSTVASGSIVFLSNATGKIDVVKSNLDGSNATTVIAGTGKEDKYSTSLLSSRDWKFSVYKASHDTDQQQMYLLTTATGKYDSFDEGNGAAFNSIGWSGHTFFYTVDRPGAVWADKAHALKSYNADTGKLTTLDETTGSGTAYYDAVYQTFSAPYLMDGELVYSKPWSYFGAYQVADKSITLYSIDTTTLKKKTIKDFPQAGSSLELSLYEPSGLYLRYTPGDNSGQQYYEYEDGAVKTVATISDSDLYDYPTYLQSPTGNKTFWYELRNGKNTIFIGDKDAKNGKQIASLSEYVPYGWYGDNDQYILFTKNGSELYIAPADQSITPDPLKVTDYYKVQTYRGYGGGYGGQ